jgi:hypothetical protein
VLLSQVQGHPPPDWHSSQLANLVVSAFPGYSATIPTFSEISRSNGTPRAFRVGYSTVGCNLRPILANPHYLPLKPAVIEQVFGRKLDTLTAAPGHRDRSWPLLLSPG